MRFIILTIFIATVGYAAPQYNAIQDDYYWKEYHTMPAMDAIPSGIKVHGVETIIGQAYIVDPNLKGLSAIIPVDVIIGIPTVDIPVFGVKRNTSTDIKVLCGTDQANFRWYKTDSKRLFDDIIASGKHLVLGGAEESGLIHIGRVTYGHGEGRIGKITTYKGYGEAMLYYADERTEMRAAIYEVLVFEKNT